MQAKRNQHNASTVRNQRDSNKRRTGIGARTKEKKVHTTEFFGLMYETKAECTKETFFKSPETQKEASEQIAIYGIKLHLNVHILVSNGENNKKNSRCLQSVPQMNYSCSVHAIKFTGKISSLANCAGHALNSRFAFHPEVDVCGKS